MLFERYARAGESVAVSMGFGIATGRQIAHRCFQFTASRAAMDGVDSFIVRLGRVQDSTSGCAGLDNNIAIGYSFGPNATDGCRLLPGRRKRCTSARLAETDPTFRSAGIRVLRREDRAPGRVWT